MSFQVVKPNVFQQALIDLQKEGRIEKPVFRKRDLLLRPIMLDELEVYLRIPPRRFVREVWSEETRNWKPTRGQPGRMSHYQLAIFDESRKRIIRILPRLYGTSMDEKLRLLKVASVLLEQLPDGQRGCVTATGLKCLSLPAKKAEKAVQK